MAVGSKLQFGTMAKPMHAGPAAQHGVMAAGLAASDVKAVAEPLADSGFAMLKSRRAAVPAEADPATLLKP